MKKFLSVLVFSGIIATVLLSFNLNRRPRMTKEVSVDPIPATELEVTTIAQAVEVEKTVVQNEAVVNDIGASFTVQTVTRDAKGPVAPPNPHLKKK